MTFRINMATMLIAIVVMSPSCSKVIEREPSKNPNPKHPLKMKVDIRELTLGTNVSAVAGYEVADKTCLPIDYAKAIGGVRAPSLYWESVTIRQKDRREFEVVVFEDFYLPEALYTQKKCEWKLSNISIRFSMNGLTRIAAVNANEAISSGNKIMYCDFKRDSVLYEPCHSDLNTESNTQFIVTIN